MLAKTKLGTLPVSRALRAGAVAALMTASIAIGVGPAAASTAHSHSATVRTLSNGSNVGWALHIRQRQARAEASMRSAGVGPSLAGNAAPAAR